MITNFSADDPATQPRLTAFVERLQQLGWTVGRNLRIDYRWTAGDAERIRKSVADVVALAPDVILAAVQLPLLLPKRICSNVVS